MTSATADKTLKKRIWGWYFFDFASQPYHTVLNTFIFGPFFVAIAATYYLNQGLVEGVADANAQAMWAWTTALIGLIIAFSAPIFGAMADSKGRKMPWIVSFSLMYVLGCGALWFTAPDASNLFWMLAAFGIGFIGAEYALIFTNAQLPGLGTREQIGKISGSGFAFGYLGGVIALAIALLLLVEQGNGKTVAGLDPLFGLDPSAREGTRATGPFAAIWFVLFMTPYFLWVREVRTDQIRSSFSEAFGQVVTSLKGLKSRRSLGYFLVGSMFYRDALNGMYTFGGFYALGVLGWSITQVGIFGIIAAIAGAVACWLSGKVDRRFGPMPVIVFCVITLTCVALLVVMITPTSILGIAVTEGSSAPDVTFFIAGAMIGAAGGSLQASSRNMLTRQANPERMTEAFGLYALSGKATSFLAPALIALTSDVTGSQRLGVSPVVGLFIVGLILLVWVKPKGDFSR